MLSLMESEPAVGAKAFIIGSPKGLDFSLSDGIVSQVRSGEAGKVLQFTCPTSPGNSGSPLLNAAGKVTGVVSFQIKEGQNLNFATPSVYVLGLDSTLSTRVWGDVAPSPPAPDSPAAKPPITDLTLGQIDYLLGRAALTAMDCRTVYACLGQRISASEGYRSGLSVDYYIVEKDLHTMIDVLQSFVTTDEKRKELKEYYLARFQAWKEAFELVVKAIQLAQTSKGWSAEASDLLKRGYAANRPRVAMPGDVFDDLHKNSTEFASLIGEYYAPPDEKLKIQFGTLRLSRHQTYISHVEKGSLAFDLALRSSDSLRAVNGQPMKVLALRQFVGENPGKRIEITVMRDGEDRKLRATIPKDLTKYE